MATKRKAKPKKAPARRKVKQPVSKAAEPEHMPQTFQPIQIKRNGAPIGNQFWKARVSHGRKPIWTDPDELWLSCVEYLEWVEENPLKELKPFQYQGVDTSIEVPRMRAMTIDGMCVFLNIHRSTWQDYRDNKGKDFSAVCSMVEAIIRDQKFTGAAAGLLNPAIIASDLGLANKLEHSGPDGGSIKTEDITEKTPPKQAYSRFKAILRPNG